MLKLVKANKQFRGVYKSYKWSDMYDLDDLYINASIYKHRAYNYCRELYSKYNGYDFKIIGGNCMSFSVGFKFIENGIEYFAYITRDYNRKIAIDGLCD